jgi:hypothetical protein
MNHPGAGLLIALGFLVFILIVRAVDKWLNK